LEVSGFLPIFLSGAFGAVLLEILRWWKLRELSPELLPPYRTSLLYWGITFAMVCAGGLLATLYGLESRNALMVVNVGASTPALIGALASPDSEKRRRTRRRSDPAVPKVERIRQFLAFGR
jgi:hypothetical protein